MSRVRLRDLGERRRGGELRADRAGRGAGDHPAATAMHVHQHLWPAALIAALARRRTPPGLYRSGGDWMLRLTGERACRIDLDDHDPDARAAAVHADGLDRALICLSSPLGIEALPAEETGPLLATFHAGVLEFGEPFGLWGAVALEDPRADTADALLAAGAVGLSVPAGALTTRRGLAHLAPLLARLEALGAPLLAHPGPAPWRPPLPADPAAPGWWPALTRYVTEMHEAWFAFLAWGRDVHPRLRAVFAMLAGGAPLHAERLARRGGSAATAHSPSTFYDVSSYGPRAVDAIVRAVGIDQLVLGSDRPVVDPPALAALGPAAERAIRQTNPARLLAPIRAPA
jgi:hypothetical protein